jgi:hypothetical protein
MSHIIVEIPKELPLDGYWVCIVAENWIKNGTLYMPDDSYSQAYKQNLLISGGEPKVDTWESFLCSKVIHQFSKLISIVYF